MPAAALLYLIALPNHKYWQYIYKKKIKKKKEEKKGFGTCPQRASIAFLARTTVVGTWLATIKYVL